MASGLCSSIGVPSTFLGTEAGICAGLMGGCWSWVTPRMLKCIAGFTTGFAWYCWCNIAISAETRTGRIVGAVLDCGIDVRVADNRGRFDSGVWGANGRFAGLGRGGCCCCCCACLAAAAWRSFCCFSICFRISCCCWGVGTPRYPPPLAVLLAACAGTVLRTGLRCPAPGEGTPARRATPPSVALGRGVLPPPSLTLLLTFAW
mmetsp:Transcript_5899/g.13140  ORF Transcript_5899/g.13140 Transcript_5899/m.13140 type:complete len:204 (+) Transcript_5899:116-727(+)